jgi:hypothetical protein
MVLNEKKYKVLLLIDVDGDANISQKIVSITQLTHPILPNDLFSAIFS